MAEEQETTPPTGPTDGVTTAGDDLPRDRVVDLEIDRELHDSYRPTR